MASITTKKLIALTVKPGLLISALALPLAGCEAPLNLEGVEQEKAKAVRRTDHLLDIAHNDQIIMAIGNDGLVLTSPKTADALDWTRHQIPSNPNLIAAASCPDQTLVALSTNREIWLSSDNGSNWHQQAIETQEELLALTCAPDNSIWAVGSFSSIMSSPDKGQNWNQFSMNEDAMLTGIQFLNANTAIVTGEFGLISRTDDGGVSWNPAEYIPNDFYTQGALFNSANEGWVGGLSGQILYTQDGGLSWTKQLTPTESPIYGFYKTDNRIFAFGDHATLLEYNGMDWQKIKTDGKPVYLRDALKVGDELLIAGGTGSLYTVDISSDVQLSQK